MSKREGLHAEARGDNPYFVSDTLESMLAQWWEKKLGSERSPGSG